MNGLLIFLSTKSSLFFYKKPNTANDAIMMINDEGKIFYWNKAAEKIFGYTHQEAIGERIQFIIPERYREAHEKGFNKFKTTGQGVVIGKTIELAALKKNGTEFPIELSLSAVKTKGKWNAIGIIRDITMRKQAEEKIKKDYYTRNMISSILQTSLEPISLEEQLKRILGLILSIPWLSLQSKGCVYVVEDEPDVLVLKAQRGLADALLTSCARVPFRKCLCGRAASTGQIIFADHIDDLHETHYEGIMPHGHYCIPITSGHRILGVINLYIDKGHKRNQEEEEFLSAVANTLAGIIERKYAEEAIQRAKGELEVRVKERTEKLNASLKEKQILLSEIHHRVKNNLQIISSLLNLQSRYVMNEKYIKLFKDSENRIQSMALIHEELYQSEDLADIDFGNYVKNLADGLFSSYGVSPDQITLNVDIAKVLLGIDKAIPCGLVINEIISNSLKYAFPEDRKGEIKIVLHPCKNDDCELIISDNGVGMPEDLDYKRTKSLGLYLVTNLVENQLNGKIELNKSEGTRFLIKFKKKIEHDMRI